MEEQTLKQRWLPIWTLLLVGSLTFSEELESTAAPPTPPTPAPAPVVETVPSELNESKAVLSPPIPWRFGLEVSGLGALSRVDYDSDFSGGFGWTIGPQLEVRLTPSLRWITTLGYQRFSVGRFVASSGVIADEYSQFIQTQEGLFAQSVFGIPVWKTSFQQKNKWKSIGILGANTFTASKPDKPVPSIPNTSFPPIASFSQFLVLRLPGGFEIPGN
ncbi:hypothetical protein EBQ90_07670 [bacterium]|nr:hypothetical protein [bacterium]